jgi:hypothetical protein
MENLGIQCVSGANFGVLSVFLDGLIHPQSSARPTRAQDTATPCSDVGGAEKLLSVMLLSRHT